MEQTTNYENMFVSIRNSYIRPTNDQVGYSVFEKPEYGYILIFNTLGIARDDLSIRIDRTDNCNFSLTVKGETEMKNANCRNSVDISVGLHLESLIEDIKYKMENGLTIVYIKTEQSKNSHKR